MLANAGTENKRDPRIGVDRQADRHSEMMSRFIEQAMATPNPRARSLTLILRSATSEAAQALIAKSAELKAAGIAPQIVLARVEPEPELRRLAQTVADLSPAGTAATAIRWAKNPRLLEAHEQVIGGESFCWSGDAMGRDPSRRNSLSLFAENAPEMVRLGQLAFVALWHASATVSERRLMSVAPAAPVVVPDMAEEECLDLSVMPPRIATWPQIRH